MKIEKALIVETALKLLDEVGSDGLSMRILAKALHVQAPTLYWHFPSKQALFDQMADALIAPVIDEVDSKGEPDEVLRSLSQALRGALLSRRDGAKVYAGTYVMGENVLAVADITLETLMRKGMNQKNAADAMFNLIYYILGFTIEEQAFNLRWDVKKDGLDLGEVSGMLGDRFPALRNALPYVFDTDFNSRFEKGISSFLLGLITADQR